MSLMIEIFTDGSCYISGDTKSSSSAFNIYAKDRLIASGGKFFKKGTGNYAEVSAVLLSLKKLDKLFDKVESSLVSYPVKIKIYLDSLITCDGLKGWIYKWVDASKDGVLVNSSGNAVANQEVFKSIYNKYLIGDKYDIEFIHLNSHMIETSLYKNNLNMIEKYYQNRHTKKITPLPKELFSTQKFKKAKKTFLSKNKYDISNVELLRLLVYNMKVDNLASEYLSNGLKGEVKNVKEEKQKAN